MAKLQVLRQTRPGVPSKMAKFDSRQKDEGQAHGRGPKAYSIDHIDEREVQKRGKVGSVSKGGQARGGTQPKNAAINYGAFQKPKFPPGGAVKASNPKTGNTRMKGKIPAQGGQYGGGGRNTQ
jgi:hypothetical protein